MVLNVPKGRSLLRASNHGEGNWMEVERLADSP